MDKLIKNDKYDRSTILADLNRIIKLTNDPRCSELKKLNQVFYSTEKALILNPSSKQKKYVKRLINIAESTVLMSELMSETSGLKASVLLQLSDYTKSEYFLEFVAYSHRKSYKELLLFIRNFNHKGVLDAHAKRYN